MTDPAAVPGRLRREVRRSSVRRGLRSLLGIGLAAELRLAVPYLAHAVRAISHPDPLWLLVAVGAELASMYAFGSVQRRMLAVFF